MNDFRALERVAVAAIVVVFAMGCAPSAPSTSPTSRPTQVATSSIGPSPLASSVPSTTGTPSTTTGWQPIPDQISISNVGLRDVVWTGSRFIAIGTDLEHGGGAVLDSSDGLSWQRQASGPEDAAYLVALAAGPRGIVAIGDIDEHRSSWVSDDGLTWTSRADAFVAFDPAADTFVLINDAIATDDGWLAVGAEHPVCMDDCGLPPIRAIVWTSTDGLEWTRVLDQGPFKGGAMSRVTRGGPGYVAVGWAGDHAAVWTSIDGRVWLRVPDTAQFHKPVGSDSEFTVLMFGVEAAGGQLIATGSIGTTSGETSPLAWWSPDGTDWSLVGADRQFGVRLGTFVSMPGGYLVIGVPGDHGCPTGSIWSSHDGTFQELVTASTGSGWPCSPGNPVSTDLNIGGAAASPERLVLVGAAEETEGLPVIWVHELP